MKYSFTLAAFVAHVSAFPWVVDVAGVDSSLIRRQQPGGPETCPYNPVHPGAVPISTKYPYCGAKNGSPGIFPCLNNRVPAVGDTAHYFTPPSSKDIRGPCPGLNTAANHNFLSHDGIVTFSELIDAQQNVYGIGYDLAVLLAALGVNLDGDITTQRLSIGCDATNRTSVNGAQSGQPGLDGHNRFEGDTSLTRNDFFVGPPPGNNFLFNSTLFKQMSSICKNNCSRDQMAYSRYVRYQQSLNGNGNFYFGPKSALLYGAASFLYENFPNGGDKGAPTQNIMNSFFVNQKLPDNWFSRSTAYSIPLVAREIFALYQEYPVAFGGNNGKPNTFVGIGEYGPYISKNILQATPAGIECLLYQLATDNVPASLTTYTNISDSNFKWVAGKLNPIYQKLGSGCPLRFA